MGKLDFAADYYSLVTGELQKADQIWQEYRENYPRDPLPLTNLTGNRQVEGDYASALELNHALLLLLAGQANYRKRVTYGSMGWDLMMLGRLDEARKTFAEQESLKLDDGDTHIRLYELAFLAGDARGMAKEVAWFDDKPNQQDGILSDEADTEAYGGHLANARKLTRQAENEASRRPQSGRGRELAYPCGAARGRPWQRCRGSPGGGGGPEARAGHP